MHRYTIDQVKLFYRAAMSNRTKEHLEMAMATRVGFHADKKQWKEYLDSMNNGKKEKAVTKGDIKRLQALLSGKCLIEK